MRTSRYIVNHPDGSYLLAINEIEHDLYVSSLTFHKPGAEWEKESLIKDWNVKQFAGENYQDVFSKAEDWIKEHIGLPISIEHLVTNEE